MSIYNEAAAPIRSDAETCAAFMAMLRLPAVWPSDKPLTQLVVGMVVRPDVLAAIRREWKGSPNLHGSPETLYGVPVLTDVEMENAADLYYSREEFRKRRDELKARAGGDGGGG